MLNTTTPDIESTETVPLPTSKSAPAIQRVEPPAAPALKLWRQTFALDNARGETEAFSIGPDQSVWHFYPETKSRGGYQLECLHLAAEAVAASLSPEGRMYVFACRGMSVTYVVESREGGRWSSPMRAALPTPGEGFRIVRLQADATAQGILLTVFADLDKPAGAAGRSDTEVAMSFTLWTQGATASRPMLEFQDSGDDQANERTKMGDYRYTAAVPLNQH
jgi:hypothetical protein